MIDYAHALNSAQYEAATCGDGPVLVVAGAGSGKTRTITYRLSWLADHGVPPESMLLLTFTRKAAQEMLQRAAALSDHALSLVQGGTFHSFAFGVLRRYRPDWLEDRPFTVMDSADINAAVKACKDDLRLGKGDRSFPRTQAIVGFLSKARNKEMRLDEVLQREAFHLLPYAEPLMQLGEAYDAYRKEKGLLDYDDLLFELEHLLRTNERAADTRTFWWTNIRTPTWFRPASCVCWPGRRAKACRRATSWPWATRPSPSTPSAARKSRTYSISRRTTPSAGSSAWNATTAPPASSWRRQIP